MAILLLVPTMCPAQFPLLSASEGDQQIELEWTLDETGIESFGGYYVYREADTTAGELWELAATLDVFDPELSDWWQDSVRTYVDSPMRNGFGHRYAVTYYIYDDGEPSEESSIEDNRTRMVYPHYCSGAPILSYEEDHDMVTLTWYLPGACDASADFGGYRVWRDDVGTVGDDYAIIKEYDRRKQTYPFRRWTAEIDSVVRDSLDNPVDTLYTYELDVLRTYVDDRVHDGFPYRYAVTYYFYDGTTEVPRSAIQDNVTQTIYPEAPSKERPLYQVYAVPNPYLGGAAWDEGDERKIQFVNLPADAIVRIYTSSGSLVRTLRNVTPSGDPNDDSNRVDWDLLNENGDRVAPDIYIFAVESKKWGDEVGRVVVVK
jgi:hypothetical protein